MTDNDPVSESIDNLISWLEAQKSTGIHQIMAMVAFVDATDKMRSHHIVDTNHIPQMLDLWRKANIQMLDDITNQGRILQ